MYFDQNSQMARRDHWYALTRQHISTVLNPDGSGRIPQFEPPYREPVWILPALYTGSAMEVGLANRIVEAYLDPSKVNRNSAREQTGRDFGIFQSNVFAHCLHRFGELLTPGAREVMVWHTEQVFKTYRGAAQPDFKFHGANDNMPMLASKGLILGGEALGNEAAVAHGVWNLNQFRRLLSRSAWASEFNSSTYSAVTLTAAAKIGTFASDPEVRRLARDIEHRLWAELLLHYHPGTKHQSGAQSRAYSIDAAGHNHAVQLLFWWAFGEEATGRDLIASYFAPNPCEVLHFAGNPWQSIAEYCDMLDAELHLPEELAPLISERSYPAVLRGRSECMGRFAGQAGTYHTETWMEEAFALGTVDQPMSGGEQTTSVFLTYKRRPEVKTFRDAATVYTKYMVGDGEFGALETSADGEFAGEAYVPSRGWSYAIQHENCALLHCTPALNLGTFTSGTLQLGLVFPAHFGCISRSIIGDGPVRDGAAGSSDTVQTVSVEAGEVFIHVQPLLPTQLARQEAVRFRRHHQYEVLELVNYEGPERSWTQAELALVFNGFVLTVEAKQGWRSLEDFHQKMSVGVVTDYGVFQHRFVSYRRGELEFEVVLTVDPFGVQTESVNGRHVARPIFESNQLDVNRLPFMTGPVAPNAPLFPWGDSLETWPYGELPWIIGSRGLPDEKNYSKMAQELKV